MDTQKEIIYELYPHQIEATRNTGRIYEKHRVAGAVMPTGSGKSFLAMAQILAINNSDYRMDEEGKIHVNINSEGTINPAKIYYVAPTNEIATQIKIDIVKYVLGKDDTKMNPKQIDDEVNNAFPNLKFLCYQTLNSDKFEFDSEIPDLVILDEVHRSGAKTFQKNTARLLGCTINENGEINLDKNAQEKKGNIRVFTISATPERDVDGKDMTKAWARAIGGYTEEELADDVRADLGIKLSLPEAEKKGIISSPEVIRFNPGLADSREYKDLLRYEKDQTLTLNLRQKIREKIEIINNEVIGIPGYDKLLEKEQEAAKRDKTIDILAQQIKNGKINLSGKYILFVPRKKDESIDTKEHLKSQKQEMEDILKEACARAGLSEIPMEFQYLSSVYSDKENEDTLTEFNSAPTDKGPLKFIIASEKLNEGVHIEGISGAFMKRNISERDNTSLRAQSILFLQQQGRTISAQTPGKERKEKRVIFDLVNNYYIQNRNGAVDKSQRIELFELTPEQQMLVDAYEEIKKDIPEKDIRDKVPRLFAILGVLEKYQPKFDADIISSKTDLQKLLSQEPFLSYKEEIEEELISRNLVDEKMKYNVGARLKEAREAFWDGKAVFKEYSLELLHKYGVLDISSKEGEKEFQAKNEKNKFIDDEGFILRGANAQFVGYNVYTGTLYNKDGKDIDGHFEGEFDPETGKNEKGYYRNGFNDKGRHYKTKTIHDEHGFMADGTNILTGTEVDLDGYNVYGIRDLILPGEEETKAEGGFDREGYYHKKLGDGTYERRGTRYATIEDYKGKKIEIDVNFFLSGRKAPINNIMSGNIYTYKTDTTQAGFYKQPRIGKPDEYLTSNGDKYDDYDGYDVNGYDVNGFNKNGIHRDTGTRLDTKGKNKRYYDFCEELKKDMDLLKERVPEKGKVDEHRFNYEGINTITQDAYDIYGFKMIDYHIKKIKQRTNEYGFKPCEVPKDVAGISDAEFREKFYKDYIDKNGRKKTVKGIDGRSQFLKVNILGTDSTGKMPDGKMHRSLEITKDYIEKCIKEGMNPKEFVEKLAKQNKLLGSEALIQLNIAINQAVVLYRICPELQKTQETKDVMKILISKETDITDLRKRCPQFRRFLVLDVEGQTKEIEHLEEIKGKEPGYNKKETLKKQIEEKSKKIRQLENILEKLEK